ncbi:MAG: DUF2220 domain-containing protein [Anaerolineae bacterium]|nr:DUF2220 domain-containing protein [Anaerolineae bacterium]
MNISFTPSSDVAAALNTLLDILERRKSPEARSIKVSLVDISMPSYFSQTDPSARLTANEQFTALEKNGLLKLTWLPGETGHLLQSVTLQTESATHIYELIHRPAKTTRQKSLESLLLAEKFRFVDDWRARALRHVLENLHAGKSPSPFSLADTNLGTDLLAVMEALSTLQAETPYRVFSVRVFNDSKRIETIKSQLVSLARIGNPEWKRLSAEEILRELNLVPNPTYLHFAGNWQLTLETGEILTLGGFFPSVGFPAAQTAQLQSVAIHVDAVLCIENLTTFHEFVRKNNQYAVICTLGNPSPALRRLLRLIPDATPIYHWSDLDYGGFNILSQLRRLVRPDIQPYRMDVATLDANYPRSRPLTASDQTNLKKLRIRPELKDMREVIAHILQRGVKLEQEGIEF